MKQTVYYKKKRLLSKTDVFKMLRFLGITLLVLNYCLKLFT